MDKTALNEQAQKKNKISAKRAEEIKVSGQIAAILKREWEELAKKQEQRGVKISASRKISSVTLTKNRRGKISVQVNMQNGARMLDNAREKHVVKFKEKAQKVYFRAKIEELLKKIKEYGYAAVEGEIPAELKEAVLKGMEKANISTSYKGAKAEAEAARQASQRAAEAADKALKTAAAAAAFGTLPPWHTEAIDSLVQAAAKSLQNNKYATLVGVPEARRPNSPSVKGKIMIDGVYYDVVGDNLKADSIKIRAAHDLLKKSEQGQHLSEEEKAFLAELAKKAKISSLEDLQKNSNLINRVADKALPEKYRFDLKQARKEGQAPINDFLQKTRNVNTGLPKVMIPLNLSVGRKIADITNDYRDHKKETSKEDKNRKALLTFYCKLSGKDEITPEAVKFMQDMTKKEISGNELWQKYKGENKSAEEMKAYITDRKNGKIPAPVPQKPRFSGMDKEKQKAADKAAKEALLAPDNAVSAEKIRQAKAVLDKETKGEALSKKEQKLLNFVHQTFKKIPELKKEDLEDPKNRRQLAAMLQCNQHYSNLPKKESSVIKQAEKIQPSKESVAKQSVTASNVPSKQPQQTKANMTEKERVISKIKENMEAYKVNPASEKQNVAKKSGLQQKLRKNQQASKTPARPAVISPAVQAALLKKKEEMSR